MIGLKELALLVALVAVLYGRSGVLKSRQFQRIWPWIAPVKRTPRRPGGLHGSVSETARAAGAGGPSSSGRLAAPRLFRLDGNRVYWFLTILAATAVAAWIVTRLLILRNAGPALDR